MFGVLRIVYLTCLSMGIALLTSSCFCCNCATSYFEKTICDAEEVCKQTEEASDEYASRVFEDVCIETSSGTASFTVSLPKTLPSGGLHAVIFLGGVEWGRESLSYVPDHGANYALIAYNYPFDPLAAEALDILTELGQVRNQVFSVPSQILTIVQWAQRQPWHDGHPVAIIGVSLGGLFVPAIYRLAYECEIPLGPGVLAYTGAGLHKIAYANLPCTSIFRGPEALMASIIFRPLEPAIHAPHMRGEFLIISGTEDKRMPLSARCKLESLIPEPKTIVHLETPHVEPTNKELTNKIILLSREWAEENHRLEKPSTDFY